MAKISRNAPCFCGSGKKYKKCHLPSDLKNAAMSKKAETPTVEKLFDEENEEMKQLYKEVQELDDLSNSVIDLIQAKNFDKAEEVCHQLLEIYPDQVDGFERMARLHEARGNREKAAQYYRKTVDFMLAHDGFETENIEWHEEQAKRLEQLLDG